MKFFKKLFVFLLVLPLAFSVVSCGDKDDESGSETPGQQQTTPSAPTDTSNVFFVSYDYDLPEDYSYLLTNPARTSGNVGENLVCLNVTGAGLADYFMGWYNSNDEEKQVVSTITGTKGEQITLKALWNEDKLEKYYYSQELTFEIESGAENVATVSGWTGDGDKVIIPEIYMYNETEYRVNAIADSVFEEKGITTLLNHAKNYSIGEKTFKGSNFDSFDFSTVTAIGSNAFENCVNFTSVELGESVAYLGDNVFAGCSNISEISVPSLYHELGRNTSFIGYFGDVRNSVTKVTLGDQIEAIPSGYFEDWANLETIELGDSIESIGNYCFDGCENLENIVGFENLNPELFTKYSIRETKFFKNLTEPLIMQDVLVLAPATVDEVLVIRDGVTKIQKDAFALNSSLKQVTIPSTVVSIGEGAFSRCSNLEKVVFAENSNLTTLETQVFSYCKKLTSINITNLKALETISYNAFDSVSVSNFVIPATVENVSTTAFYNAAVVSFEVQTGNTKVVAQDGVLYLVDGPDKTLVSYPKLKTGEMFIMPEDVTVIGDFAFINSAYLQWIYVTQASLEFASLYVFDGAVNNISIIAEKDTIVSPSYLNEVYYMLTDGYTYILDASGVSLSLGADFEPIEDASNYFVKIEVAGAESTYRYFIFSVSSETAGQDVTYSINENSVVELTEYFA